MYIFNKKHIALQINLLTSHNKVRGELGLFCC